MPCFLTYKQVKFIAKIGFISQYLCIVEALEFTFEKSNQKTPTIGVYSDTFLLLKGNIINQKFKLQSGIYVERKERDFHPSGDFHLIKPKSDERVISIRKPIADEGTYLPIKIFFGELTELLLAELYYVHHKFERCFFNYSTKQLVYGNRKNTFLSIELISNKYLITVEIQFPVSKNKHRAEYEQHTNEFKLIEKLLK